MSSSRLGNPPSVRPFISTETSISLGPRIAWPPTHGSLDETTMASADFPPIRPTGSPQVRTCCFPTQPPHLLPWTEPSRLRCVVPARLPRRPSIRFLFIGSSVSSSLPSHGRLPFRSWLRVVVFSCFHVWFFYRGLAPHLQRAHAGHIQLRPLNASKSRR